MLPADELIITVDRYTEVHVEFEEHEPFARLEHQTFGELRAKIREQKAVINRLENDIANLQLELEHDETTL